MRREDRDRRTELLIHVRRHAPNSSRDRRVRNMSFALTTAQVRARTKTVTRRGGWLFAKVGDVVQPVVKSQGIKKGEHVEKIGGPIRFVAVDRVVLGDISAQDVHR